MRIDRPLPDPYRFSTASRLLEDRSARGRLREWLRRRRSRLMIATLDRATLRDIGVSFSEAEAEANKPWWRA